VISGFTDDVATTRGENTSPVVAITQPDNIDCKYSSAGGSSDDVTARGDNNPSADAIAQPQDCKYSSVGGSSDDVTAQGDNNPPAVAITQPAHTQTENTDTDTILTQNTISSYDTNRKLARILRQEERKEKNAKRMKEKRDADREYRAKERETDKEHKRETRRDDRENKDLNKATFATKVGDMFKKDKDGKVLLNTIGYETIPNGELGPEVAAMNMHMASKNRLQEITMQVYQENPTEENRNHVIKMIEDQAITPERQHSKGIEFYDETGRGCDWDSKTKSKYSTNDKESQDAQLTACSCCGIHDQFTLGNSNSFLLCSSFVPFKNKFGDKINVLHTLGKNK